MQKSASQTESVDALRDAAIAAAISLLTIGGAAALSVRSLAGALGTSTKFIYSHFGGMPQVLAAVNAHATRSLSDRLDSGDDVTVSRVERLWRLARAFRAFATREPHLFALLFDGHGADSLDRVGEMTLPTHRLVWRILAPPHATAAVAETSRLQALAFAASLHGPVSLEASGCLGADAEQVFETVVNQAIRAAIAPPVRVTRL